MLLQQLALDGLRRYNDEVEAALDDDGDPGEAFAAFMRRSLDAGASSLSRRLAGHVHAVGRAQRGGAAGVRADAAAARPHEGRGRAARGDRGGRPDADLRGAPGARTSARPSARASLRHRYLALLLEALRAPAGEPLPGPAPTWPEMSGRWAP